MFLNRKYLSSFISLVGIFLSLEDIIASEIQQPSLPLTKNKFIVVAHRGSHLNFPENTLEAFDEAISEGADYVEIDLRTSKDSELVILHDATVDRMTDGKGFVKETTLADLKKLRIKNKTQTPEIAFTIPTFREVLKLCKNKINIYLDFKDADAGKAYAQLQEYGMEKQVIVYINNKDQFQAWRKVAPSIPLMVSIPSSVNNTATLKAFLDTLHPDILDGDAEQYTEEMIAEAMRNNCFVLPDIQNSSDNPGVWDIAIRKGIKGLQTDHPHEMIIYLKNNNLR